MAILETLIAAGGGTITGAVAGVSASYFQYKLQEAEVPIKLRQMDLEEKLSNHETDRTRIDAGKESLKSAHESDKATYGIKFVDLIRGLVRPLITSWCIYIMSDLTITLWEIQDHDLNTEYWREMFRHLIVTWTYLTTTVVMYYFGSRGGRPPAL